MKQGIILAGLIALNLLAAISVVTAKQESRNLRGELQVLRVERDDLNTEWSQLQLEESAWTNPDRISRLAGQRLRMEYPDEYHVLEAGQ